jgi:hypothetical protein
MISSVILCLSLRLSSLTRSRVMAVVRLLGFLSRCIINSQARFRLPPQEKLLRQMSERFPYVRRVVNDEGAEYALSFSVLKDSGFHGWRQLIKD